MSLSNFLNTAEERHAFLIGWAETLLPCRPIFTRISEDLHRQIEAEYHYYALGRIAGFFCWAGLVFGLIFAIL